jgi:methylmalonyl-CoA mutase
MKKNKYKDPVYTFKVRDKNKNANAYGITFSFSNPENSFTEVQLGDILRWCLQENVPGEYPFTGLYPFKSGEKILLVCLQVREDQKQTNVSLRKC